MKIKRYVAPDIRQAMKMVRDEQGPDAVILSNRRVEGGVEIVAALDFDEQAVQDKLAEQASESAQIKTAPAPAVPLPSVAERFCATRPSTTNRNQTASRRETEKPRFPEGRREAENLRLNESRREAENLRLNESRREAESLRLPAESRRILAEPPEIALEKVGPPQPSQATVELLARLRGEPNSRREPSMAKTAAPTARASQGTRPTAAPAPIARSSAAITESDEPAEEVVSAKSPASIPSGHESSLALLQQELRALRRVVDTRLSEAGWQASSNNLNTTRVELLRGLCERGFSKRIALYLANRLSHVEDTELAWRQTKDILAQQLTVADDQLLEYGGIAALVGPTGVGKTTTIAKLAAKFRLKHGPRQIALITIDNYRIAAHEHLHTYGRLLDVPVAIAANGEELQRALRGFLDKKLVLIDTAGMGPYDSRLEEQLSMIKDSEIAIKPYLVISAATQLHGLEKVVEVFGGCQPQACILTKLDEAMQPAMALSVLMRHRLLLSFIADGQQVPEDLHMARAADLIGRCFGGAPSVEEDADSGYAFEDWVANGSL